MFSRLHNTCINLLVLVEFLIILEVVLVDNVSNGVPFAANAMQALMLTRLETAFPQHAGRPRPLFPKLRLLQTVRACEAAMASLAGAIASTVADHGRQLKQSAPPLHVRVTETQPSPCSSLAAALLRSAPSCSMSPMSISDGVARLLWRSQRL